MLQLFISYAHQDLNHARRLFDALNEFPGVEVWFDKESLLPGETWELAIRDAISCSRFFLLLLSENSTTKKGFYQKEVRLALKILEELPQGEIYLVPIRLDECEPHFNELLAIHYVDLFPDWDTGFERILKAIGVSHAAANDTTERILKLRVHKGFFVNSPMECYFINAANLSPSRPLEVTHVWYEDEVHHIPIELASRPLPIRLELDQTWETWIEVNSIPEKYRHDAHGKFRARISTGDVFESVLNSDVPPRGKVPGGRVYRIDVQDNEGWAHELHTKDTASEVPAPKHASQAGAVEIGREAKELPLEAALRPESGGYIVRMQSLEGLSIAVNQGRTLLDSDQDARSEARWDNALNELLRHGLINDPKGKGEVFKVTHSGYGAADAMQKPSRGGDP